MNEYEYANMVESNKDSYPEDVVLFEYLKTKYGQSNYADALGHFDFGEGFQECNIGSPNLFNYYDIGDIEYMNFEGCIIKDFGFLKKHFEEITYLEFVGCNITGESTSFNDFKNLEELGFSTSKKFDFSWIDSCAMLNDLNVVFSELCNFTAINKHRNIRYLVLNNCDIETIEDLSETFLIGLRSLNLNNNPISDISKLKKCINLDGLSIKNTPVNSIKVLNSLMNEHLNDNNELISLKVNQ